MIAGYDDWGRERMFVEEVRGDRRRITKFGFEFLKPGDQRLYTLDHNKPLKPQMGSLRAAATQYGLRYGRHFATRRMSTLTVRIERLK